MNAIAQVAENLGWANDTDQIVFAHTHQPLAPAHMQRAPPSIKRAVSHIHLNTGGAVMATAIVSIALRSSGYEWLSRALLLVAVVLWIGLGAVSLSRLVLDRGRLLGEAERVSALTEVAGTAVLGSRLVLLGSYWAAWPLLATATLLGLLLTLVLRVKAAHAPGASFLVVVAPQSVAVLGAQIASHQHLAWLAAMSFAAFAWGLCSYPAVLARFDFGELRAGAGDQWVAGGALAISALACGELANAQSAVHVLSGIHDALGVASLVLWVLAIAWLPALLLGEARWPRLDYNVRRWATVFPLGMYAAMSFTVASVNKIGEIGDFARAWTWVALGMWAVVAAGVLKRLASSA